MTKLDFIMALYDKLSDMPHSEVEERVNFYSEMIEDRMEDGLSEEEAVAAVGSVDEVAAQIKGEAGTDNLNKDKKSESKKGRMSALQITLLALGSPIWLSLLIAAFAIIISLFAVLFSLVVSCFAVFGSFVGVSFYGIAFGIAWMLSGKAISGLALFGVGIFLAGLSIFAFFASKALTKLSVRLSKGLVDWFMHRILRKEEAK